MLPRSLAAAWMVAIVGCAPAESLKVVVYASGRADAIGSALAAAGRSSGIVVEPSFAVGADVEAPGLSRRIIRESPRPRCDLIWDGRIFDALRLQQRGMLATWATTGASSLPPPFQAGDGTWHVVAARARVLILNTAAVAEADRPLGLADLVAPRWKGRVAIASPLRGDTAAHFACLFAAWGDDRARGFLADLKRNEVRVLPGDAEVADAVGSGLFAIGLTGAVEAAGQVAQGRPAAIVYPDQQPGRAGTLFLPEVLAIPKGSPHPAEAEKLGNALLLAVHIEIPPGVRVMDVDFEAAALLWDRAAAWIAAEFAGW